MTDVQRGELEWDKIATFWIKINNTEFFDDVEIYTVEVPVREHKRPKVKEVKEREIENLEKYGVFEEVEDNRQETVGSR